VPGAVLLVALLGFAGCGTAHRRVYDGSAVEDSLFAHLAHGRHFVRLPWTVAVNDDGCRIIGVLGLRGLGPARRFTCAEEAVNDPPGAGQPFAMQSPLTTTAATRRVYVA
jgi:hypothetical protein